jgi:hypothetical protein
MLLAVSRTGPGTARSLPVPGPVVQLEGWGAIRVSRDHLGGRPGPGAVERRRVTVAARVRTISGERMGGGRCKRREGACDALP